MLNLFLGVPLIYNQVFFIHWFVRICGWIYFFALICEGWSSSMFCNDLWSGSIYLRCRSIFYIDLWGGSTSMFCSELWGGSMLTSDMWWGSKLCTDLWHGDSTLPSEFLFGLLTRVWITEVGVKILIQQLCGLFTKISPLSPEIVCSVTFKFLLTEFFLIKFKTLQ